MTAMNIPDPLAGGVAAEQACLYATHPNSDSRTADAGRSGTEYVRVGTSLYTCLLTFLIRDLGLRIWI